MTFNVAIVGSGPAGFYVADALLQSGMSIRVDMIDRLPVPFGLVRHGVAPDHQKLKAVTSVFEGIADHENFSFLGNLEVGRDVDVAQLRQAYDAVVIATGAIADRPLGIEGEELPGSVSASEFVGWYNGHPDFRDRVFDLSQPNAVIIGNGNVALDVCRILSKDIEELRRSDICEHALDALASSRVTDIFLVGRRGPTQAKFTTKELREFGDLVSSAPVVDPDELSLNYASIEELESPQAGNAPRNLDVLRNFAKADAAAGKPKRVHFRFLLSPARVLGTDRVQGVAFERVELSGPAFNQSTVPTGTEVTIPAGLLVRSIGYRGTPIAGVPFDARSATIPHKDGRVQDGQGASVDGVYVAGWIKRGPSGIIGTNRACGTDTALAILADLQAMSGESPDKQGRREQLVNSLRHPSRRPVDFDGWRRIDTLERAAGAAVEKPREKMTSVRAMLEAAESNSLPPSAV